MLLLLYIKYHCSNDSSTHCDYIIKKLNRRLYALRKLKACGVQDGELVAVYCSLLRSVLEYVSVVFANLPQYLCKALERVQKRALRIIFGLIFFNSKVINMLFLFTSLSKLPSRKGVENKMSGEALS